MAFPAWSPRTRRVAEVSRWLGDSMVVASSWGRKPFLEPAAAGSKTGFRLQDG